MTRKGQLLKQYLTMIAFALCFSPFAFAAPMLVAPEQPVKEGITYLKQDAPVFETTIPEMRATFNQQNPELFLSEYKIITNNDITIPLVRAATRITPHLYSSTVLERGSEKIKSLQLTLIHRPNLAKADVDEQEIARQYLIALVTQFDNSITSAQIDEVLDLFAFKDDTPVYISHNVGAIRYIIAHEGDQLTTFAIEPVKLSLNGNIDSAIP
ncbi:DUF1454 family protein [Proteus myxofaciens]|uniref:DUF1454 family protein n=1 Tax=Proteus myxofaciens ATCC 19692 TaxID=1354337 RepID=A0A198FTI9_9GAMM|nr:DUF1454 family protein [Proteus myxofaciens]OAT28183.1 hypothetical protein M983_1742 [Proteus myxofaciens ATCC 19692]